MNWASRLLSTLGLKRVDLTNLPPTEGEILASRQRHPPGWVYVKTVDHQGRILEEGWEFNEAPDRFEVNGLAQLPGYVDRLLTSKNWLCSVSFLSLDEERAVMFSKTDGQVELQEFFLSPGMSESERRARTICQERGFAISLEYETDEPRTAITWALPSERDVIVSVLSQFAREIHDISESEGLDFRFDEPEDERGKFADRDGICFLFTYPIEDPTAPPPSLKPA
jgi:hypothetical protein